MLQNIIQPMQQRYRPVRQKRLPFLKFISPQNEVFPFDSQTITFGKSPKADIKINGLFMENIHGFIGKSNANFFILNLGWTKMTKVNGKRIKRCMLRAGDLIQIGKMSCIFFQ